ncbi:hypothetical protein [Candidatus Halobonum tyrrellensis]|uniref:Uncharacterized protein n=1 Tax=Candidatus Halobonum tyrrellensis G22 TaxID=1324957 RepID=V4HFH6_9EURY|nr:hypothetical protein [Candidatus Halobonum tyrrellensis]ESP88823.1 hypothetical protein K933_06997 [Candidatus Halobonum tyrrellensis G22]
MSNEESLSRFAADVASAVPPVDAETTGRYGDGLGSESEERQVDALVDYLAERHERYRGVEREVAYPERAARCDLRLADGTPVEAKLLRYWRANGDPEPHAYGHVFSPFDANTLLTDAKRLSESGFDRPGGLLGLFYERAPDDPVTVPESPERFGAETLARKAVVDLDFWYDLNASVAAIERFDGLRHPVHRRGAAIAWALE